MAHTLECIQSIPERGFFAFVFFIFIFIFLEKFQQILSGLFFSLCFKMLRHFSSLPSFWKLNDRTRSRNPAKNFRIVAASKDWEGEEKLKSCRKAQIWKIGSKLEKSLSSWLVEKILKSQENSQESWNGSLDSTWKVFDSFSTCRLIEKNINTNKKKKSSFFIEVLI